MAIQDDILSMFRRIGDAGDRATRRGEAGLAILDQLTPMERMQLSSMYNPEQFSSLEEAMTFNPLIGSKALDLYEARVGTEAETKPAQAAETLVPGIDEFEMPSGGLSSLIDTAPPTRGTPAPRTPVSVKALPDPESMAGLLMAAPDEGSMALLREQYRRNVGPIDEMNEEMQTRVYGGIDEFGRRLPGAMQVQAEQEGVYGKREIPAAAGEDIPGVLGREIGTSFGRRAAREQAEYDALALGLGANPGVRAAYVAAKLNVRALGGAGRIIRNLLGQGRIAEAESMVDDILYQVGPAQARNLLEGFRRTALPPPSGGSMPQISGPPTIPRLPGPPSRGQLPSPPPVPRLTGQQMRNPETGTYMPRGSTYITPSAAGRIGSEYGPPMFDGLLYNKGGAVRQSMIDRYKRMY